MKRKILISVEGCDGSGKSHFMRQLYGLLSGMCADFDVTSRRGRVGRYSPKSLGEPIKLSFPTPDDGLAVEVLEAHAKGDHDKQARLFMEDIHDTLERFGIKDDGFEYTFDIKEDTYDADYTFVLTDRSLVSTFVYQGMVPLMLLSSAETEDAWYLAAQRALCLLEAGAGPRAVRSLLTNGRIQDTPPQILIILLGEREEAWGRIQARRGESQLGAMEERRAFEATHAAYRLLATLALAPNTWVIGSGLTPAEIWMQATQVFTTVFPTVSREEDEMVHSFYSEK